VKHTPGLYNDGQSQPSCYGYHIKYIISGQYSWWHSRRNGL